MRYVLALLTVLVAAPLAAQTRACTKLATGIWRCQLPPDTVRRTDTVRITTTRVDTVWRHDTIFVSTPPVPVPVPVPTPVPEPVPTPVPVPVNPGYPNEPAGMTALFDWDTDFANPNPGGIWFYTDKLTNLSTVTDPTAPVNPLKVGRVRFSPGCCDGSGPAQLRSVRLSPPAGWSQFYVSDWWKFDPTWKPHSCCQKMFELFWSSGGDKWLIVKADPSGGFPLIPRLNAFFGGEPQTLGGRALIQPGVWYQVELVLHRAGRVQLFIREQGKSSEVLYDGPLANAGTIQPTEVFWWWGYGGLGAYSGVTSYIYHNHIRVSWR